MVALFAACTALDVASVVERLSAIQIASNDAILAASTLVTAVVAGVTVNSAPSIQSQRLCLSPFLTTISTKAETRSKTYYNSKCKTGQEDLVLKVSRFVELRAEVSNPVDGRLERLKVLQAMGHERWGCQRQRFK